MTEGFETRQVVQSVGPSGQANRPARQLGLVNVQAPRGGNVSAVGNAQRTLAEAVKMGGKLLSGHLRKKEEEDRVLAGLDVAEGATEAELKKRGVSRARLEGFKALKLKIAHNEWFTRSVQQIEEGDYALDTDTYKERLHGEYKELRDAIDPNDTDSLRLLSALAEDSFGKLVSRQVASNASYMQGESVTTLSNLLYSEAQTGDIESLAEVANNVEGLSPNLSSDAKQEAVMSAVRQSLLDGNVALYDVFGQEEGLRNQFNLDEGQIKSLKTAYREYQIQNESEHFGEITQNYNDITLDIHEKNINREEAFERVRVLSDEYEVADAYRRRMLSQVNQLYFDEDLNELEAAMLYDPGYIEDKSKLIQRIGWEGLQNGKGVSDMLKIADKYNLRHDMVRKDLEGVVEAHNRYKRRESSKIEEALKVKEEATRKRLKATSLLNGNFSNLQNESSEVRQLALDIKRTQIMQEVANNPRFESDEEKVGEIIRQHVQFLRDVPIKDEHVKQNFNVISQSSPLQEDGTMSQAHIQAYQYLGAMGESGLSERTIKAYAGSSYEYLSTALELSQGVIDPELALATAWDVTQRDPSVQPRTNPDKLKERWGKTKDKFFDRIEPSVVAGWLGEDSDGKYDEVLTWQVKQVAANSEHMDRWAQDRMEVYSKTFPKMSEDAIFGLVRKDLSEWEYTLGNLIPPKNGVSVTEAMGLEETPGALKTNSAVLMYMQDNADLLFPPGTRENSWARELRPKGAAAMDWNPVFIVANGLKNPHAWNPAVMASKRSKFSEVQQQLVNSISMLDLQMMDNGNLMITLYEPDDRERQFPIGVPRIVPAKDMGDWYKAKTRERQFEDNAPRR